MSVEIEIAPPFDPYIARLALVGLRAARVSMGKTPDIESDGLGGWRMSLWMRDVRRWLAGETIPDDHAFRATAEAARLAVLAEHRKRSA